MRWNDGTDGERRKKCEREKREGERRTADEKEEEKVRERSREGMDGLTGLS